MKKFLQNMVLAGVLIALPPLYPSSVKNPVTLGNWLGKNFTYQAEAPRKDYWKTPNETLKDKGGDCDDLAILAQHILKELGYKAYLVVIDYYKTGEGHAICIIKHKDETFSYISNLIYYETRYNSVPELLDSRTRPRGIKWKVCWVVISKNAKLGIPLWRNK